METSLVLDTQEALSLSLIAIYTHPEDLQRLRGPVVLPQKPIQLLAEAAGGHASYSHIF